MELLCHEISQISVSGNLFSVHGIQNKSKHLTSLKGRNRFQACVNEVLALLGCYVA